MLRIVVVGGTMLIIVVISVIAIVVSTSQGADWSESCWKSDKKNTDSDES